MPTRSALMVSLLIGAAGCSGVQSSLEPGGLEAERMARLYWWMAGGALFIWIAVIALAVWCVQGASGAPNRSRDRALIVGGGVIVPLIVLTGLLSYGLVMIPPLVARAPEGSVRIAVTGEQWWWRVVYERDGAPPVETANEVRLPVGERVQFRLDSDNVIHSFWIPALGGKMDMIPGRVTWLALQPTRTGYYRGACAEYCGGSHALMAFDVDVTERNAFDRWLDQQAQPAAAPAGPLAQQGYDVFFAAGCSACHTIRGTPAAGRIGPDLTHVGSRRTLAGATLPNGRDALRRWIAQADRIKPEAHMPRFEMLPPAELDALAAYLESLE